MPYIHAFSEEGPFDVVVRVSGRPTPAELRSGRRRLLADLQPGMNVLVDHTGLDPAETSTEELRALAASAGVEWSKAGVAHLVMFAPAPVNYGLLRLWHTLLPEELGARTAVVRTLDEAYAWLAARSARPGHD